MIALDELAFAYTPHVIFRAQPAWQFGREPVLRRMRDDTLVCVIYSGGPFEPHNDNLVLITRSADDGITWSPPEVLFTHSARAAWATELFTEGDRPCLFVQTFDAASHYAELKIYRAFSDDHGRTWSAPAMIPGGANSGSVRQGIVLRDGAWVFPLYWQEAAGNWDWQTPGPKFQWHRNWWFRCGVLRSTDQGASFELHGNLTAAHHLWEPNVVEIAPNHLLMLMRAEGHPVKFRSDSTEVGVTWSAPEPTTIPEANSKITLLRHGDALLMLHNPSAEAGWQHRRTLALWISRDGGRTWPQQIELVRSCKDGLVVCYPHAFIDPARHSLYIACDTVQAHYMFSVPLVDLHLG